ncbi:hypothetical protein BD309DRAFT_7670 [Dichomitus squalens]|nr:hypothetical protein BD309DRAFT_7670 [Dichomitus squalens]
MGASRLTTTPASTTMAAGAGLPVTVVNSIPRTTGSRMVIVSVPIPSTTGPVALSVIHRVMTATLAATTVKASLCFSTGVVTSRSLLVTMKEILAIMGGASASTPQVSLVHLPANDSTLTALPQPVHFGTAPHLRHEVTTPGTRTLNSRHSSVSLRNPCTMGTRPAPWHPSGPSRNIRQRSLNSLLRTYKEVPSPKKVGPSYKTIAGTIVQFTPIESYSHLPSGDHLSRRRSRSRDRHQSSRRSPSRYHSQRPPSRYRSQHPPSRLSSPHATSVSDASSKPSTRAGSRPIRQ